MILKRIGKEWDFKLKATEWDFRYENIILKQLPILNISVLNVATALAAIFSSNFKISKKTIYNNLKKIILPGRFQKILNKPQVIVDVAHNPHAALYLSNNLKNLNIDNTQKIFAIVGMLKHKDIKNTLLPLLKYVDFWNCAPINTKKTADAHQITQNIPIKSSCIYNTISDAFDHVYKICNKQDIILVFGSFFTVSEILQKIKNVNKI